MTCNIKNDMIKRIASLFAIYLISVVSMRAQLYDWALRPTLKTIDQYADNAYKAKDTNNKSWLLNDEGYNIYDPSIENAYSLKYDSISPIIGGYGLLMNFDL